MRHGQSIANVQGIIISHPMNGVRTEYALSDLGRDQVRRSARESGLSKDTIVYVSDFSRAIETASIVRAELGMSDVHVTKALRERNFGDWEYTHNANYENVWTLDRANASHTEQNVESVDAVLDRVTGLIAELEKRHSHTDILLVSHGDTLQILQTSFQNIRPEYHRDMRQFETAEIREMLLAC